MQTANLTIPAMHNEAVALQVAKALESVSGVDQVHINLAHTRARVGFDGAKVTPVQLRAAVQSAGYVVDEESGKQGCCGGCGG